MLKLLRYPFKLLWSLAQVLLILALVLAIVATMKITGYEQSVNEQALASKQDYLKKIPAFSDIAESARPNIVFVLYDDLGYGDFSYTGSESIQTPNIDQLAENGAVIEQFYSPAPICTPSRFGFLTGRHAERGGMSHVVFPEGHNFDKFIRLRGLNVGIPSSEITLADILSAAGYKTSLIGKWHLGDQPGSRPNDMGFQHFYGSLYSNDMEPFAFYRNNEIEIEAPVDQTKLSELYVRETKAFIESNKDSPFFLYLAHNFPHIPLFVRDERLGKSDAGLYGDVVQELDAGIGEIVQSLKDAGVYDNTIIIISSDNGPWYQGSPGNMRGRKGETFEGGVHVPFVAHWPEGFCSGCRLDGMASGLDLMPTIMDILKLPRPQDRTIDGKSLLGFLQGESDSPHEFLYYLSGKAYGVRDARFKYMPERPIMYNLAGAPFGFGVKKGPWLFDLSKDQNESYNASARHPEQLKRLEKAFQDKQKEMDQKPDGFHLHGLAVPMHKAGTTQ